MRPDPEEELMNSLGQMLARIEEMRRAEAEENRRFLKALLDPPALQLYPVHQETSKLPTPEAQDPSELPNPEPQDPSELPTSEAQDPSELQTSEVQDPSELLNPEVQDPSELPTPVPVGAADP
ncbi:uncharacterized protein LOC130195413 [Pseudoliparis swirei]|uniref:uncharacterized protein LOC130195413 n=1 Tax=Pseudoliparis swirei TaxID=2059687 RepID=UPI0024BDFBC1|nr:uncharacterized protein LOC130195413 [Pseudoliparis swirei]